MAYLVNRHMLRGISVFCEPPQKPINRGVHVERKITNSLVLFRAESNRFFSLSRFLSQIVFRLRKESYT